MVFKTFVVVFLAYVFVPLASFFQFHIFLFFHIFYVHMHFIIKGKFTCSSCFNKHIIFLFFVINISNVMTLALNITSRNMRGIPFPAKRVKILNHLHKLKSDICLLQKTHLTEAVSETQSQMDGLTDHSTYNSKKKKKK